MNKKDIQISIITSVFNSGSTLLQCIDSVKLQQNINVEHLIIDGNSTDGSVQIIETEAGKKDSVISWWVSEKDNGIYDAWNKALSHINGDWVLFLGADDTIYNSLTLEESYKELLAVPEDIRIAYGKLNIIDEKSYVWFNKWANFKKEFRNGHSLRHTAVFHRHSLFEKNGNFDDSFKIAGDSEYLLRELIENEAFDIDVLIANHYGGGVSSNIKSYRRQLIEGLRIKKIYKIPRNPICRILVIAKIKIKLLILLLPERIASTLLDLGRLLQFKRLYWSVVHKDKFKN